MRDRRHIFVSVACLIFLLIIGCSDGSDIGTLSSSELREEYNRLRAVNAVLRARVSLSKHNEPYLIVDLPEREVRLELQGMVLTRAPIDGVKLNRQAKSISRDTTRVAFCETPFVLEEEGWYEHARTLALKDSTAVMSSPDTTGKLTEKVRKARVISLLHFDRNLVVALNGRHRPSSIFARLGGWFSSVWHLVRPGSGEWPLRKVRREKILVELRMEPGMVRTLAPNLREGTRLVLLF